ncbi:MAG: helix-turn-helix domain-containing protein [Planctomycetia bacterium]|nr:helix-turn-helix domain-containing protein [Planctomycetia bacterium]
MRKFETLDAIVHAPVRLAILTILISVKSADFTYLKEATETTDGNLGTHLQKLEDAGYVKVLKSFVDNKPKTTLSITMSGRKSYEKYVEDINNYLKL